MISDRFCGIEYKDNQTVMLAYSVYLPTSGKDDKFLEVLSSLSADINMHNKHNADIVLGCDTNQSSKSTRRRTCAMANFLSEFSLNTILENDEPTFHHNNLTSESQIDHIL